MRGPRHRGPKCKCGMPALALSLQSVQARAHGTNKHGTSQGRGTMLSTPPSTGGQLSIPGDPQGKWAPLSPPPFTGESPGEEGPTVYASIYWGTSRGGGAHCLYSIYSGTSRGSGPHCLHLHLLENLQGKWTHCLHFCLLGNLQQRGPLSTLPSTGEPPGEVGPTVYTSCYWGNSRGSGPHCLHLYWGTSRGSGFHCLHLHLLGKLQGRRSQLSTPLPTGEPPGEERDHCLHFHPLGNLQGRRGPLSTPPSTGEPPGEEGPTVYTSVYWGTSRGEVGHTVYTSIYWETGR